MKISQINNYPMQLHSAFGTTNKQNKQNYVNNNTITNSLVDKNYNLLQINNKISFKSKMGLIKSKTGKKVANLFDVLRSNDIIVAAPSYDNALKAVDKHINKFDKVIKKMYFIEDRTLNEAVGFKRDLNENQIVNLSENSLFITDKVGRMFSIHSGDKGFLLNGDRIQQGKTYFSIKMTKDTDLPLSDSYTNVIDFQRNVDRKISKINKSSLSTLMQKTTLPQTKIFYQNIGGQDDVIKEVKKTVLFPMKFPNLKNGKNMNKNVLLYGPPGTGKSLIAEATANEASKLGNEQVWYKKINASELDDKYVGESEKNWIRLFDEAKNNQPSIIFIDEFDAVARKRDGKDVYGAKTLNTVLSLMSDTEKSGDRVWVMAATNNEKMLDNAAIRSGRVGKAIKVGEPDKKGKEQIFDIYTKDEPLSKDLDKAKVINQLQDEHVVGADIASIVETARDNAIERNGLYEKMDKPEYTPEMLDGDLKKLAISNDDFTKSIADFNEKKRNLSGKPASVGFKN